MKKKMRNEPKKRISTKKIPKKKLAERGVDTRRVDLFCAEYIKDFNGSRAAIACGYSDKAKGWTASSLLALDYTQKRITKLVEERLHKLEISKDDVLDEIAAVAFSDIGEHIRYRTEEKEVTPNKKFPDIKRIEKEHIFELLDSQTIDTRCVKSIRTNREGSISVSMHDKIPALSMLAEFYKITTPEKDKDNTISDLTAIISEAYKSQKPLKAEATED